MVIYVVILVFTLLAPFVNSIDKKHNYNKFIIMLFIFIVGMRARNVGTDTDNYWNSYLYSMGNRVEPLFFFLRNICRSLSLSVNAYFTLIAILTFVPLWEVIKKNSFNPGFSLLIYYTFSTLFFFQTFNVVRACLAVSYILLSCSFLQRNNINKAFFYSIIALLFHYSAILIILFVLLAYIWKKIKFNQLLPIVIISFIVGFVGENYIQDLAFNLSTAEFFISNDSDAVENFQGYLTDYEGATWNIVGKLATMLPFSFFTLLMYNENNSSNIFYKLLFIGTIINNAFVTAMFTYRITMYLLIFIILVLPNTYILAKSFRKLLLLGLTLFMILWFIYTLITATDLSFNEAYPYQFCISD